jgi:hypothetical protein
VVKESRVPKVCLLQCLHGKSMWILWTFKWSGGRKLETILQKAYVQLLFLFLYCGVDSTPVGLDVHVPLKLRTRWHTFDKTRNLNSPDVICPPPPIIQISSRGWFKKVVGPVRIVMHSLDSPALKTRVGQLLKFLFADISVGLLKASFQYGEEISRADKEA